MVAWRRRPMIHEQDQTHESVFGLVTPSAGCWSLPRASRPQRTGEDISEVNAVGSNAGAEHGVRVCASCHGSGSGPSARRRREGRRVPGGTICAKSGGFLVILPSGA